jgi:hypothetical protein
MNALTKESKTDSTELVASRTHAFPLKKIQEQALRGM